LHITRDTISVTHQWQYPTGTSWCWQLSSFCDYC